MRLATSTAALWNTVGTRRAGLLLPPQRLCVEAVHSSAQQQGDGVQERRETLVQWTCPNMMRHYEAGARFYRMASGENLRFPSVTSVLNVIDKPGLKEWAVKLTIQEASTLLKSKSRQTTLGDHEIDLALRESKGAPDRFVKAASDLGTRAHDAIDVLVRGESDKMDFEPDVMPAVNNFRNWWKWSGVTLDPRGDSFIFSQKFGYAGAMDALGRTPDGDLMVCDWKTSNSVHETHILQVAAYAKALEEQLLASGVPPSDAKVKRACVVRFDKYKDAFDMHYLPDVDDAFRAFKSALYLWHFKREMKSGHGHNGMAVTTKFRDGKLMP